jgi:hypothetical protein
MGACASGCAGGPVEAGKTPRDPMPPDPPDRRNPRGDARQGGLSMAQQYDQRSGTGAIKRGMSKADEPAGQPPPGGSNTEAAHRASMGLGVMGRGEVKPT